MVVDKDTDSAMTAQARERWRSLPSKLDLCQLGGECGEHVMIGAKEDK